MWDFYTGARAPKACLPVGVVLTIPAAGSEMSDGSVVTNEDGNLKRSVGSNMARPKFAIMNPLRTMTLPPYQTACGMTDMIMHTLERYFCVDSARQLTDSIAEALIRTVMDVAPRLMANPDNYDLRAEIMWAGSLAHNDLTGQGGYGDWATHQLEHELSGMFDVAHGAGLAAIWGSWATYAFEAGEARFAHFATAVMGICPEGKDEHQLATEGIAAMVAFFKSIGMPTSIPELIGRKATDAEIDEMADKCSLFKTATMGAYRPLAYEDMKKVYALANE